MAASAAQSTANPEEGAPEDEGPSLLSFRGARMPREQAGYQVQPSCYRHPGDGALGGRGLGCGMRALLLFEEVQRGRIRRQAGLEDSEVATEKKGP